MRHGKDYTYAISRLDGTCVLGSIKQCDETDLTIDKDLQRDVGVHVQAKEAITDVASISCGG